RALGFLRSPRELAAKLRQRGLVVRLVDVRQRHRSAAVPLADRLVVWQVDANGRNRPGLACFDDDIDRVGGDAVSGMLPEPRIPRHTIFEPLRVLGNRANLECLLAVYIPDECFPRTLDAASVEVHLDEAVDGVDGR